MSELGPDILPWLYSIGLLILGFVLMPRRSRDPGVQHFGIMGFGTVCVGVLLAYRKLGVEAAVVVGLLGLAGTAYLVVFLIRSRAWQRLVLETETGQGSGYESTPVGFTELLAQKGVAITPVASQRPGAVRRPRRGRRDRRGFH